jgi:hypothetical protein
MISRYGFKTNLPNPGAALAQSELLPAARGEDCWQRFLTNLVHAREAQPGDSCRQTFTRAREPQREFFRKGLHARTRARLAEVGNAFAMVSTREGSGNKKDC